MAAREKDKPESFEQMLERVEAIIERIEGGELGLEDQLKEYEAGVRLLRACRDVLDRCELRVEEINIELTKLDNRGGDGVADERR